MRLQKIFNYLILCSLFSLGFILGSGNFPLIIFQIIYWFWFSSAILSGMLLFVLLKRENNVKNDFKRLKVRKKELQNKKVDL